MNQEYHQQWVLNISIEFWIYVSYELRIPPVMSFEYQEGNLFVFKGLLESYILRWPEHCPMSKCIEFAPLCCSESENAIPEEACELFPFKNCQECHHTHLLLLFCII